MAGVSIDSNALAVARSIELHGVAVGRRAQKVVAHYGLMLQAKVKRNAALPRSGPPGPRLQTGDYNRSITLRVGLLNAMVGTNKPQGRRLEFGFTGVDSLGRYYDQPPYPHFGPALDDIETPFVSALGAIMGAGW